MGVPTAAAARPVAGSAGLGDRLFPLAGNGGYEVDHYDLRLRYATRAPTQGIAGTVRIAAHARRALARFDLDFAGDAVGRVTVDGRRARARRHGEELVVTPRRALRRGHRFTVVLRGVRSHPRRPVAGDLRSEAFFSTPDGSVMAAQPVGAHLVFPCNDHPSDKATFSFRIDVPAGETALANGVRTGRRTAHGRTVWTYAMREPMATELTQLAVGDYRVASRPAAAGVRLRDATPPRLVSRLDAFTHEREDLLWLIHRLGPFPFPVYGVLVVDPNLGFGIETQTLSLITGSTDDAGAVHEMAHQWFGDSVSPERWSDVWLNEGQATYYEWAFAAEHGTLVHEPRFGATTLTGAMHRVYAVSNAMRAGSGPVARPPAGRPGEPFTDSTYRGGALTLYALREKVGEKAFSRIERTWVRRYRGRSASTANFIALASRVAHRRLGPFLRAWLYGTRTPPMPGHPGWRSH